MANIQASTSKCWSPAWRAAPSLTAGSSRRKATPWLSVPSTENCRSGRSHQGVPVWPIQSRPSRIRRWSLFCLPVEGLPGGRSGSRQRHCASVKSPRLTPSKRDHIPETSAVCRRTIGNPDMFQRATTRHRPLLWGQCPLSRAPTPAPYDRGEAHNRKSFPRGCSSHPVRYDTGSSQRPSLRVTATRSGPRAARRAGSNGERSTVRAFPSRISSAIASPVAGALRMPQTL